MSNSESKINRRTFLSNSAVLIAGGSVFASTALSYGRVLGANDHISLCHIGTGSRGTELYWIVSQLRASHNVEMTGLCDLWRLNREKAVAKNAKFLWPRAARVSVFGGRTCA